jgi:hypothetical protein
MELRRSPSGALILGPTTGTRAVAVFGLLFVAGLLGAWAWTRIDDVQGLSLRQAALLTLIALVLFALVGGFSFLRVALGGQVAFDGRKCVVSRNGGRLCGYDEIEELRIVVSRGRDRAYQEVVWYRLQLVLRKGALRWISEEEGAQDAVNSAAQGVAAELGVKVRVFG